MLFEARDVTAVLAGDAGPVLVLDAAQLELSAGEIVDVTGPSGAGKSMLLRALARLLPGATAALVLDSVPAEKIAPQAWREQVALVPQKPAIVDGSVRDNLLLPWTLKARHGHRAPTDSMLAEAIERVGLDVALDRDAARLSVGQQARVALLRVLLTAPRVLLLDEPDAALDDASADAVSAMTREFADAGGAVVRVRHHRADGLAARRLLLQGGCLIPAPATATATAEEITP
ncbi:MAG: ATP-binding cassette domain-containing protein [Coriobacteriia bacterium]|nr:ATP-binding cassette domain-containing protein [Coriobacteriia bacterium]